MKGYWIYKHLNENGECIYVGLTTNLHQRQNSHLLNSSWKENIYEIYYADAYNKETMKIYEKYYINKLNPKNNIVDNITDNKIILEGLLDLDFKLYKKDDIMNSNIVNNDSDFLEEISNYLNESKEEKFNKINNITLSIDFVLTVGIKEAFVYNILKERLKIDLKYGREVSEDTICISNSELKELSGLDRAPQNKCFDNLEKMRFIKKETIQNKRFVKILWQNRYLQTFANIESRK